MVSDHESPREKEQKDPKNVLENLDEDLNNIV